MLNKIIFYTAVLAYSVFSRSENPVKLGIGVILNIPSEKVKIISDSTDASELIVYDSIQLNIRNLEQSSGKYETDDIPTILKYEKTYIETMVYNARVSEIKKFSKGYYIIAEFYKGKKIIYLKSLSKKLQLSISFDINNESSALKTIDTLLDQIKLAD